MSATTSEDVQRLQKLVLHNPTVIDCTDMPASMTDMAASNAAGVASHIQHFGISCDRCAQIHLVWNNLSGSHGHSGRIQLILFLKVQIIDCLLLLSNKHYIILEMQLVWPCASSDLVPHVTQCSDTFILLESADMPARVIGNATIWARPFYYLCTIIMATTQHAHFRLFCLG